MNLSRLLAVGSIALAGVAATSQAADLIPRDVLFGNPERAQARLSPDGKWISYLAPYEGVMNVWVAPATDASAAKAITADAGRGIRNHFWAYDNRHVLYTQDKDGDENWRLYGVDAAKALTVPPGQAAARDFTPFDGVQARVQGTDYRRPNEMLIAVNNRVPQVHDLHILNLETGELTLQAECPPGVAGWVTDNDWNVRYAQRITRDGGSELIEQDQDGNWSVALAIPGEDGLTTNPAGWSKDNQTLYMLDSRGRDTAALVAWDVEAGTFDHIASHPNADMSGAIAHPTSYKIQAVQFNYLRNELEILDSSIKPDMDYLKTIAQKYGHEVAITSRTLDDSKWIVAFPDDDGPLSYYLYNRPERTAEYLFSNRPALEGLPLAEMTPVVIESRDGLDLVSYLTIPADKRASEDASTPTATEPLPMVLLVHGGPWARDSWGYNSLHQLLANRGYAVLSVNFRGSTGFGKSFTNAGNFEWAGKMHDDLIDATNWAIDKGIAHPERVAIMGGSYGGYATLVGLTVTPDVFAAGVDIVGPSNLVTLLESIPPYWEPVKNLFTSRVGDTETEEGRAFLESKSPLNFVDQITKPLLIGQGANDPRVKQAESDQIVDVMASKGIPVTYVLFPDEGHGFARPENNMAFFAVTEAFLAEHLGGRYQPIGDDVTKSSATIPHGSEFVTGLAE